MKLYNNIVTEEKFPPENIESTSEECIDIPYLRNKPEVINISVGRQLFVDDFLIEKTDLKRVEHRPVKYKDNPVFYAQTPWEKGEVTRYRELLRPSGTELLSGGMWYDGKRRKYRMWYTAGFFGPLAYAESDDGINFSRVSCDIYGDTNIVFPRAGQLLEENTVILNHYPENGEKSEYVMSLYIRPHVCERVGLNIFSSTDGMHWTYRTHTSSKGLTNANGCDDTSNITYNPFRKKWIYSIKKSEPPLWRTRYYAEGDTLIGARDSEPVFWQRTDCLDLSHPQWQHRPQLYVFNSIAYESVMLGAYDIWKGPENDECMKTGTPKTTEIHIGFSRDGFHYSRQKDRSAFIAPSFDDRQWDNNYLHASNTICLIKDNELWFYYTGFKGDSSMLSDKEQENGMYSEGAIGIAVLRRDGFASLDGTGSITTEKLEFDGKYLFINARAMELSAELLDEEGMPITGFEADNCIPFSGDSCKTELHWKNKEDLSEIAGRTIKIRFIQKSGSLYAFWISKKSTGESNGYLAGGEYGKELLCDC